jgi:ubiquinone/menaquinone biosynthesis C-methylase UbiE
MGRSLAYKFYWKVEQKIVPGLKSSQYHYQEAVSGGVLPGGRWLDLGCGHQVFAEWMIEEEREVVSRAGFFAGIDVDVPGIRGHRSLHNPVLGNLTMLPFSDGAFEIVTANMVVEHLDQPLAVLAEVYRVLRPGGRFIFHTPNARCISILVGSWLPQTAKNLLIRFFEARQEHDVFKTFYRMNTAQEVSTLGAKAGFDIADIRQVNSSAATIMLGPLVLVELLALRILARPAFAGRRSNIIAILEKRP